MPKFMLKWIMFVIFLLLPLAGYTHSADTGPEADVAFFEPSLRVGIVINQPSVQISAAANFDLTDSATGKVLFAFRAGDKVTIAAQEKTLSVNGAAVAAKGFGVVVRKNEALEAGEQLAQVNNRRYRGGLSIHRTAGQTGLTVVNTLPVEQYLYGVIKNEISPAWPLEAVKAQAVAARTYALANYNKHKADGFDVCSTTDCQVYGGRESEDPRSLAAVDATRGLVVKHSGKLITAYFHSSSGGYTENSENVWSTPLPYLRGVVGYDQNCPNFTWEKRLTAAEFNQAISKAGYNIGSLQAIELSPLAKPPVVGADRGISGRVKTVRLRGSNGSAEISGTQLRSMLELKSTLFDIRIPAAGAKALLPAVNADKKKRPSSRKKNRQAAPLDPNIRTLSGRPDEAVVITGSGWGHGIGLSQWGAKAMAEQAPPDNTEYFKDILQHYYQGVQVKKAYL
ncbi:SpoIID/LytB domain-containing protein [Sporomusa termitida]|uniref:SpoIID/LytB domain protein n=1 Tax=Sporomusa termitida TaxID=2377 RepID=A0A517DU27_9FIRM|nr:SpoIID/LytB domain-containing protein [Sporomusa termitida]QDR80860.1 SpoIID/LytB domain protein [Sporomusa termitida]